jgi:hypothetical protein
MKAKQTLAEGKKMPLRREALAQFLLQKQIEGKSRQTLCFYPKKIEKFLSATGDRTAALRQYDR